MKDHVAVILEALWQLQIAVTCECIYLRHWSDPVCNHPKGFYQREEVTRYGVFHTQIRDRLYWDEGLRSRKELA